MKVKTGQYAGGSTGADELQLEDVTRIIASHRDIFDIMRPQDRWLAGAILSKLIPEGWEVVKKETPIE